MNRWMAGFIAGVMLVLPFAVFILLIQPSPGEPNRTISQEGLQVPASTQIAPVRTGIPPLPSTNPTVVNAAAEPTGRVIPVVTVIRDTSVREPYYSPTPGLPTPVPDPAELARLPVSERLRRIFDGGTGTIIARNLDDDIIATPDAVTAGGPIIRGYVIEEVPVDPPVTIEPGYDAFPVGWLCMGEAEAPCVVNRLWRITVIGKGFSTDYPTGAVINPSPVSIWIDGTFLGYGWRNGYDADDGATVLIRDATPLREGSLIGIGQGPGSVLLQGIPTPSIPKYFTKPVHFIGTPTP